MRATINNASLKRNKLIAGQFVRVVLRDLYVSQAYNIPQESIFRDQESNYVMIEENNVVHKHRIKAGKYMADGTQIVEAGLTDGMHVVTNGGVRVTDNDPVTIDQVVKDAVPQP
jgi:membrane fusion protein (multidrug efflux system)